VSYGELARPMPAFCSLAIDLSPGRTNGGRLGITHESGGCKHAVLHGPCNSDDGTNETAATVIS
jgi:hypothetical protein